MPSVINSNSISSFIRNVHSDANVEKASAIERMSSGKRINSAMDDAAALAMVSKMSSKISGQERFIENALGAMALIQTSDGAVTEVGAIIQRMNDLALQASSGTLNDSDRKTLQNEFEQLSLMIDQISEITSYNGISLLNKKDTLSFMVNDQGIGKVNFNTIDLSTKQLGTVIIDHELDKPIATIHPPNGTFDANLESNLWVTFNEDVFTPDSAALNNANISSYITLLKDGSTPVNATFSITNNVVKITPAAPLQDGGTYTITVNDVIDSEGYAINETVSVFTARLGAIIPTQIYSDVPSDGTVATVSPPNNATDVDTTSNLFITLNGDDLYDDQGNLLSDADIFSRISISSSNDPNVDALLTNASFSRVGNVITVTPSQPLMSYGEYSLNLSEIYELNDQNFANSDFDLTGAIDNPDGTTTINGWTIYKERVDLGVDSIGGFISPDDNTYPITNSSKDDNVPSTLGSYSYSAGTSGGIQLRVSGVRTRSGYDVVHGPYILSNDYTAIKAGSRVTFDWEATGGGDAYDVYSYLLKDDGTTLSLLDKTGTSTSGGDTGSVDFTVPSDGNYKFVFVNGTFDLSGGMAAGAKFDVRNLEVIDSTPIVDKLVANSVSSSFTSYESGSRDSIMYTAAEPAAVYSGDPIVSSSSKTLAFIDISTMKNASEALTVIELAMEIITNYKAVVGSTINRLSASISSLQTSLQYYTKANSIINDADYALESAKLAKAQILENATTSLITQANATKDDVLNLIKE